MKKVSAFFRLVRINNLLIMLLTQVLSYYFLSPAISLINLLETRFILLCISTLFVGAGGYIINDYLDIKLDLINKPNKVVVGQVISRRWTMFWHLALNISALLMGIYIGTKVSIAILVAAVLLWVYSVSLKRKFLVGNLLVSILSAFVIIINYIYDTSLNLNHIVAYSFFAFTLTLLREIIKDTEDIRGDGKFDCKTIPIILGVRKTKSILLNLTAIFAIILLGYTALFIASYSFQYSITKAAFIFYMIFFVIVPLGAVLYKTKLADTTADFSRLSLYAKLIMLSGMISMIFWRL
jgi:4-hydroxybenzoate polyprenyltransferase